MAMIEGAGVALSVSESGEGAALLLVHDLGSSAAALGPVRAAAVVEGWHAIAYDRRGYGESGAPDVYRATTIHEQAEDAAAVLRAVAGEPAVVAGFGFGAVVVLDVLVRHGALVSGAVVVDPHVFAFVPEANEPLAAERLALEEALRAHGPAGAAAVLGGEPSDARAALADYAGRASWTPSRRELRAISVPVAVVATPTAPAHVAMATRALTTNLPTATTAPNLGTALSTLA